MLGTSAPKPLLIKKGNPVWIFTSGLFSSDNLPYEKIGEKDPVCIADEVPFEIPESWVWCRLGDIFQHNTGKALNSSNRDGELLEYITTSNLYWNRFELDSLRKMYFTESEIEKCTVSKGDLLVCEGGDIGRSAIWNYDYDIRIQNHIHRLRAYMDVCTEYFYYLFYFFKNVGLIGGKGIGIQGLSANTLHNLLFPLPPVNEQKRIVEQIKIIKPYTDRYAEANERIDTLNSTFPDLLKKSILQQAVMGKLVPQDENDEPASVLLERIRAEKEALINAGKLKKDKHESIIYRRDNSHYEKLDGVERCIDDEIPFEIPQNWVWCRLSSLGEIVGGGTPKTEEAEYWNGGTIAWLTPADMKYVSGKYVSHGERFITNAGLQGSSAQLMPKGTVVYSSRAPIGYVAISLNEICTNQGFKSLIPAIVGINQYIYYCLIERTPEIQSRASGTTFKEISGSEFGRTLIPLPPMNEQKRIVTEIERILPLCDKL